MTITVITKTDEWQVGKLKEAADALGINLDIRDFLENSKTDDLGDVVIWRSSSLGRTQKRIDVMREIDRTRILINNCLAHYPEAADKEFQRKHVAENAPLIATIPTFICKDKDDLIASIRDGKIRYPFIRKPKLGSKGEGVFLVSDEKDFSLITDTEGQVFQNFIRNSGDYRALVFGGKVLGVIKRTAKDGGFLNNISQGGTASLVTDEKILPEIRFIATTVASVFKLSLCGVDIIYDEDARKFLFLEVNTVPQWKGFQEATGIDVAKLIVSHLERLATRSATGTFDSVLKEYTADIDFLWDKKFHFLSRMYLWTRDASFKPGLDNLRKTYIGESDQEIEEKIRLILSARPTHDVRMLARESRELFFKKYPLLDTALAALFKNLFCEVIYGIDLRPIIEKMTPDETLLDIKMALEKDDDALRTLSTHAINYFYTLQHYFRHENARVDLNMLLRVGSSYERERDGSNYSMLQLYFFTHCIIGASEFYSREIPNEDLPVYRTMLSKMDEIIHENYPSIPLDNKFEFLVCCRMCGYASLNEGRIYEEADLSLSTYGNYLVDTVNSNASPSGKNDLLHSEHRNVLFLMSKLPFHGELNAH